MRRLVPSVNFHSCLESFAGLVEAGNRTRSRGQPGYFSRFQGACLRCSYFCFLFPDSQHTHTALVNFPSPDKMPYKNRFKIKKDWIGLVAPEASVVDCPALGWWQGSRVWWQQALGGEKLLTSGCQGSEEEAGRAPDLLQRYATKDLSSFHKQCVPVLRTFSPGYLVLGSAHRT